MGHVSATYVPYIAHRIYTTYVTDSQDSTVLPPIMQTVVLYRQSAGAETYILSRIYKDITKVLEHMKDEKW